MRARRGLGGALVDVPAVDAVRRHHVAVRTRAAEGPGRVVTAERTARQTLGALVDVNTCLWNTVDMDLFTIWKRHPKPVTGLGFGITRLHFLRGFSISNLGSRVIARITSQTGIAIRN